MTPCLMENCDSLTWWGEDYCRSCKELIIQRIQLLEAQRTRRKLQRRQTSVMREQERNGTTFQKPQHRFHRPKKER